jgi:hypothetical protein
MRRRVATTASNTSLRREAAQHMFTGPPKKQNVTLLESTVCKRFMIAPETFERTGG